MRNTKVSVSLTFVLVLFVSLAIPAEAQAVIQNLNGAIGQNQTFQSDSNVTMTRSGDTHILGWQNLLPISRGGTGVGSFTTGSLFFFNGSAFAENNSKLFWDNTNFRLGIGTSSPASTLGVNGNASISGNLDVTGDISAANFDLLGLVPYTGSTSNVNLGDNSLTAGSLISVNDANIHSLTVGRGSGSVLYNTAIGIDALSNNTTGPNNTAIGYRALAANTNQGGNTAIGLRALENINSGADNNTAVGSGTLDDGSMGGSDNSAFGSSALTNNTSGDNNTAIGMTSMSNNTTGSSNVALGYSALGGNTTGNQNVAIGQRSFPSNLTGANNIVVGFEAAQYQADGSSALTTASNSIFLGTLARGFNNSDSNSIVIGYNAIGAGANKTVIGNSSMADVYFGSADANSNIHAKRLFLGSSSIPGCIVMGDTAGGVSYITLDNGALTISSTPPSACQ